MTKIMANIDKAYYSVENRVPSCVEYIRMFSPKYILAKININGGDRTFRYRRSGRDINNVTFYIPDSVLLTFLPANENKKFIRRVSYLFFIDEDGAACFPYMKNVSIVTEKITLPWICDITLKLPMGLELYECIDRIVDFIFNSTYNDSSEINEGCSGYSLYYDRLDRSPFEYDKEYINGKMIPCGYTIEGLEQRLANFEIRDRGILDSVMEFEPHECSVLYEL